MTVFDSPYEQHAARNGEPVTVTGVIDTPAGAPFFKGGALESTNPRVPAPFPRDYKGWTINPRNMHGLYTATNYGAGYGQVAADTLQGIKHMITQTITEGPRQ